MNVDKNECKKPKAVELRQIGGRLDERRPCGSSRRRGDPGKRSTEEDRGRKVLKGGYLQAMADDEEAEHYCDKDERDSCHFSRRLEVEPARNRGNLRRLFKALLNDGLWFLFGENLYFFGSHRASFWRSSHWRLHQRVMPQFWLNG